MAIVCIFLAILLPALTPGVASSSCSWVSFEDVYNRSTNVFSGIVVERMVAPAPDAPPMHTYQAAYRVVVAQVWKGSCADTVVFYSQEYCECNVGRYKMGEHYLLFCGQYNGLNDSVGNLRNGIIEQAYIERYLLGQPKVLRAELETQPIMAEDIVQLLNRDDKRVRNYAANVLREVVEDRDWVLDELRKILLGIRPGNNEATLNAIARFGPDAAALLPDLKAAAASEVSEIWRAALNAVLRVGGPAEFFREFWPHVDSMPRQKREFMWERVGYDYVKIDQVARERMVKDLIRTFQAEQDEGVRILALQILSWPGIIGEPFRKLFMEVENSDDSEQVRLEAGKAIRELNKKQ